MLQSLSQSLTRPLTAPLTGAVGSGSFASTVAAWFDSGSPGRFVPTYRDWATSGALWQDPKTPVTALEQIVWLNLDRSRNLRRGPELVVNGDFAAGATGWAVAGADSTHIVTFGTGSMRYQSDTSTPVLALTGTTTASLIVGRIYEVTTDVISSSAIGLKSDRFAEGIVGPALGKTASLYQCTSTGTLNLYRNGPNVDLTLRSISVKEVLGTHRIQPTTTSRQTLTARKNQILSSEDITPAGWALTLNGGTPTKTSANVVTFTGVNEILYRLANLTAVPVGTPMVVSAELSGTGTVQLAALNGAGSFAGFTVITLTPTPMRYSFSVINNAAGNACGIAIRSTAAGPVGISKAQLVIGTEEGRYQRVTTVTDYDSVGFPVGLRSDGIDDGSFTTASIDLSGTAFLSIAGAWRPESSTGTQLLIESSPVYSANDGAIEVSLNEINAGGLVFSRRVGGTVQYRHQGPGQAIPRSVGLTGRLNSTLPSQADVDFQVGGTLAPLTGGSPSSAPAMGNYVWSYGRRHLGGLYYAGMEYGDFAIGLYRSDAEMNYLNAEFTKNFSEAL